MTTIETTVAPGPTTTGDLAIEQAGLVLLAGYLPMLFERLGLVVAHVFRDPAARDEAVHGLEYVVSGLSPTTRAASPLANVLCGLPVSHRVAVGVEITDERRRLVDGLIGAAIGHWPAVASTSIAGFRSNWLVRDGVLQERNARWELIVAKRPYDLLIHKSPFSFAHLHYPWMDRPLHVDWAY